MTGDLLRIICWNRPMTFPGRLGELENRVLGVINRCIVYKTKDILLCLYKSLVHPHLEYCTVAWSPHYVKDKKTVGARSKKVYSFTS